MDFPSTSINCDADLYWIHCNRCFSNYIKRDKPYFLLACRHVLCEPCLTSQATTSATATAAVSTYICTICSQFVRGRLVNNSLPSNIKNLFHPEPWCDDLPTFQILSFQLPQREHYIMKIIKQKQQLMLETRKCKAARNAVIIKYQRIESLRKERRQLEKQIRAHHETRKRVEHASCPTIRSTTDESCFYMHSIQKHHRMPLHRLDQLTAVSYSSISDTSLPNPTVLNFADAHNSTFKL